MIKATPLGEKKITLSLCECLEILILISRYMAEIRSHPHGEGGAGGIQEGKDWK